MSYWCAHHHHTRLSWSAGAEVPELWVCPHCGLPAGRDVAAPPPPPAYRPFKTPLEYLMQRRTEADCEALLAEALDDLRVRRRAAARDGPHGPRDRPPRGR
ncbi:RNA polymerase-binding protein RbpA [Pseudonocardia sp. NPDC049154]|uniref:RNA polymerase-binding protein RbpA n=1 Tax=Pseudonocardia sp. NPDC049154 TaxID=3155501 RepID=UPI0034052E92